MYPSTGKLVKAYAAVARTGWKNASTTKYESPHTVNELELTENDEIRSERSCGDAHLVAETHIEVAR